MSCLVRQGVPSFLVQVATTYFGSCQDQEQEAANPAEASSGRAARARVRAERVSFIFVLLADDLMSWMVLLISNLLSERQRGGGFLYKQTTKHSSGLPLQKGLGITLLNRGRTSRRLHRAELVSVGSRIRSQSVNTNVKELLS